MMLCPFLLLALSQPAQSETIYFGAMAGASAHIAMSELGLVNGLAYDASSRTLAGIVYIDEVWHIRQWSKSGVRVSDGVLPDNVTPCASLHGCGSELRLVASDVRRSWPPLYTVASTPLGRAGSLALHDGERGGGSYDDFLDSARVVKVRRLLAKLKWYPPPRVPEGGYPARDSDPIGHTSVNVRDTWDFLVCSRDGRTWAYGWREGVGGHLRAAIEVAPGKYNLYDLGPVVSAIVKEQGASLGKVKLTALQADPAAVVIALDLPGVSGPHLVAWVRLDRGKAVLVRTKPGRLARPLPRFRLGGSAEVPARSPRADGSPGAG